MEAEGPNWTRTDILLYRIIPNKGTPLIEAPPNFEGRSLLYHVYYSYTWFSKSNIAAN